MKFVIVHGSFGNPDEGWIPELAERLRLLDQDVIIPQFPVDTWESVTERGPKAILHHQNLTNWLDTFSKIYTTIKKGEKLCFVSHLLGCLFILHAVSHFQIPLDCAVFVSPFLTKLDKQWQIDLANKTFYLGFNKITRPQYFVELINGEAGFLV